MSKADWVGVEVYRPRKRGIYPVEYARGKREFAYWDGTEWRHKRTGEPVRYKVVSWYTARLRRKDCGDWRRVAEEVTE